MLGIFAHSFMTATRTGDVPMRSVSPKATKRPGRWLPKGHWWRETPRAIDPMKF